MVISLIVGCNWQTVGAATVWYALWIGDLMVMHVENAHHCFVFLLYHCCCFVVTIYTGDKISTGNYKD